MQIQIEKIIIHQTISIATQYEIIEQGKIFISFQTGKIGSSQRKEIQPNGKHNRRILTAGFDVKKQIKEYQKIRLYFQWTEFLSGLSEQSNQAKKEELKTVPGKFLDIKQKGFFVAGEYEINKWGIGIGYEIFDRFDYAVFKYDNYNKDSDKENDNQKSILGIIKYQWNKEILVRIMGHYIKKSCTRSFKYFFKGEHKKRKIRN